MYFHLTSNTFRFLVKEWNVYDRVLEDLPRTNNALESLNRSLNKTLGHANPTIWEIIEALQNEETSARLKIVHNERGDETKQNKLYKDITDQLYNLVSDYKKDCTEPHKRMKFLEMVSFKLKKIEVTEVDMERNIEEVESQD